MGVREWRTYCDRASDGLCEWYKQKVNIWSLLNQADSWAAGALPKLQNVLASISRAAVDTFPLMMAL